MATHALDLCEFKARLVYIVSFRTARATQGDLVPNNQRENQNKTQRRVCCAYYGLVWVLCCRIQELSRVGEWQRQRPEQQSTEFHSSATGHREEFHSSAMGHRKEFHSSATGTERLAVPRNLSMFGSFL